MPDHPGDDQLAIEDPLEISLLASDRDRPAIFSVTMRTPGRDEYLLAGRLFFEVGGNFLSASPLLLSKVAMVCGWREALRAPQSLIHRAHMGKLAQC